MQNPAWPNARDLQDAAGTDSQWMDRVELLRGKGLAVAVMVRPRAWPALLKPACSTSGGWPACSRNTVCIKVDIRYGYVRHGGILMHCAPQRNPSRCDFHTVCLSFARAAKQRHASGPTNYSSRNPVAAQSPNPHAIVPITLDQIRN